MNSVFGFIRFLTVNNGYRFLLSPKRKTCSARINPIHPSSHKEIPKNRIALGGVVQAMVRALYHTTRTVSYLPDNMKLMFHSCPLYISSALKKLRYYPCRKHTLSHGVGGYKREFTLNIPTNLLFTAKDIVKAVQRGDVIIVIDVLRCCSTIVAALANAAEGIIPTKTVGEALILHKKHPEFILAGERRGIKPEGFDLGNSPLEFSPQMVKGKHIILTTTSGTKAIILSKNAKYVFTGVFLNAEATANAALKTAEREGTGVSIISAGTNGRFSLEDFICAGAIVESFPSNNVEHSDAVLAALLAFQQARESLNMVIQSGYHARYLISQGFEEDVKFCSQLDVFKLVPFLKGETIIPLNGSLLFY